MPVAVANGSNFLPSLIQRGFALGPLLFGLLFLPPVIAQLIVATGTDTVFGLSPLAIGFLIGVPAGIAAQLTGTWLPGIER